MPITAARLAKANAHLNTLVRSSAFGITTRKERIDKAIAQGCTIEVARVRDEARERAIERELQAMRGRNGWGVPTGNQCHPITIRFNALQEELKDGPMTVEYRLHFADYWNVLTKTEYDYAIEQVSVAARLVNR